MSLSSPSRVTVRFWRNFRQSTSIFLRTFPNSKLLHVRYLSTLPRSELFKALSQHDPSSIAVIHSRSGKEFTYGKLVHDVAEARKRLRSQTTRWSLSGQRIAFLVENSYDYVVTFLSIIASDAIALPIATTFPDDEISYILSNSDASSFLASSRYKTKAEKIVASQLESKPMLSIIPKINPDQSLMQPIDWDDGSIENGGLMLYTSGTTSRPKGVVLSTSVINAQARSLMEAWNYRASDLLLHVLPLHHIHGTINALYTPLMAGSTIEFQYPFNADAVWQRFAAPFLNQDEQHKARIVSLFTVVPTIYSRLLSDYSQLADQLKAAASKALLPKHLRLNISGSAALPTPVKDSWTKLSGGNVLLERYGMTEVGMALSCGLEFEDRVDGSVGWPLPGVEVRLVDTETGAVIPSGEEIGENGQVREGEIQLRGPTVFSSYWRNSDATRQEFVIDVGTGQKWFKTGDVAARCEVPTAGRGSQPWAKGPMYFIKGRRSVDIIKTGGEKVSALEVERELLSLPQVAEAAVLGTSSDNWGQKVSAIIMLTPAGKQVDDRGRRWGPLDIRRALKDKLASYKIPQDIKIVDHIPRNAMGKVNKKCLLQEHYPQIKG